jgi:hypothetical protein
MEVLLLAVMGAVNIGCFVIGARVGQKTAKGEPVELPNPVKAAREAVLEREARHEQQEHQRKLETVLHNIDRYDGTTNGQAEIK